MNMLSSRRFLPLFITQFIGAFCDNVFKNAFVLLATFGLAQAHGWNPAYTVYLIGGLFILPFFLGPVDPALAFRQAVRRRDRAVHDRDDFEAAERLRRSGARLFRGDGRVVEPGVLDVGGVRIRSGWNGFQYALPTGYGRDICQVESSRKK